MLRFKFIDTEKQNGVAGFFCSLGFKFKSHTDESWIPFFNGMTEWEGRTAFLVGVIALDGMTDFLVLMLRAKISCNLREPLKQPPAIWHSTFNGDQYHITFGIRKAQCQNLGHERPDLAGWEVYDGGDLASNQRFRGVVFGDLGRGFFDADVCAEIDAEFEGGLSGFGEGFGCDDGADADVGFVEVVEGDVRGQLASSFDRSAAALTALTNNGSMPSSAINTCKAA
jgi:hypothetical protein